MSGGLTFAQVVAKSVVNTQVQEREQVTPVYLGGVPSQQLIYWNTLLASLFNDVPQLMHALSLSPSVVFDGTTLAPEQWLSLLCVYNNTFITAAGVPECSYQMQLDALSHNRLVPAKLCVQHRVQEFIQLQIPSNVVVLDFMQFATPIPAGVHPLLYDALRWVEQNVATASPFPHVRLFKIAISDAEANHLSPQSVCYITPQFMNRNYDYWLQHFMNKCTFMLFSREKHVMCKFCFPSELATAAFMLENNAPPDAFLRHDEPEESLLRQTRLKQFLSELSKHQCLEANCREHTTCFRQAYEVYVHRLWSKIYDEAMSRYQGDINIVSVLNKFEAHLHRAIESIASR